MSRIGVFVCQCGTNIGGVVNTQEVAAYASTLPNVVHVENNKYTCSDPNQKQIKEAIEGIKSDVDFDIDEIQTLPQDTVELEGEDMELFERLMNNLNACDDVDQIYHNVANYDEGE